MKDLGCHSRNAEPKNLLPPVFVIAVRSADPRLACFRTKVLSLDLIFLDRDLRKGFPKPKFCPKTPPWLIGFLKLIPSSRTLT